MEQMFPKWQQGEVEAHLRHTGVWAEHGRESGEAERKQERWAAETQCERRHVQETRVQLERTHKQRAEVLKHLREEVPEQADIGAQVGDVQAAT